jgi:hypothetical protein
MRCCAASALTEPPRTRGMLAQVRRAARHHRWRRLACSVCMWRCWLPYQGARGMSDASCHIHATHLTASRRALLWLKNNAALLCRGATPSATANCAAVRTTDQCCLLRCCHGSCGNAGRCARSLAAAAGGRGARKCCRHHKLKAALASTAVNRLGGHRHAGGAAAGGVHSCGTHMVGHATGTACVCAGDVRGHTPQHALAALPTPACCCCASPSHKTSHSTAQHSN